MKFGMPSFKRYKKVKARALNQHGIPIEITGEGLLARALQHEIDHLNGKLFIDHISKLKRDFIVKKFTKAAKRAEEDA